MYNLSRDTTGQDANRMTRRRQRNQGGDEEDSDTAEGEEFGEQAVKAAYKSRGTYKARGTTGGSAQGQQPTEAQRSRASTAHLLLLHVTLRKSLLLLQVPH